MSSPAYPFQIRPATSLDAPSITEILNHYILYTYVNFAHRPLPPTHVPNAISNLSRLSLPFLVAVSTEGTEETILGFASASPYTPSKLGYAATLELSLYVHPEKRSKGAGTALLHAIIQYLEDKDNFYLTFSEGGELQNTDSGTGEEPVGLSVKCKLLLAIMAIDPDKALDGKVLEFYMRNGFKETGDIQGIGWKFGRKLGVRMLALDLNSEWDPTSVLGG
ncbi:N-acetyltransferase [Dactylella cylindrospora]|nr:N-acetyltransferase [Dactylella cylindrospora]